MEIRLDIDKKGGENEKEIKRLMKSSTALET